MATHTVSALPLARSTTISARVAPMHSGSKRTAMIVLTHFAIERPATCPASDRADKKACSQIGNRLEEKTGGRLSAAQRRCWPEQARCPETRYRPPAWTNSNRFHPDWPRYGRLRAVEFWPAPEALPASQPWQSSLPLLDSPRPWRQRSFPPTQALPALPPPQSLQPGQGPEQLPPLPLPAPSPEPP